MEEAYSELYQEFLQLRSLCLRQAALLHKLTKALQKQQGATVPNGELNDLMSIPVQCTQKIPVYPHEKPDMAHNPAANVGTFSDLLTEDMSKLCMTVAHRRKDDGKVEHKHLSNAGHAGQPGGNRTLQAMRLPVTGSLSLNDAHQQLTAGVLMSDVALQSHVCDFCQAVFPGDSTTRGEFLRHLYTHVT